MPPKDGRRTEQARKVSHKEPSPLLRRQSLLPLRLPFAFASVSQSVTHTQRPPPTQLKEGGGAGGGGGPCRRKEGRGKKGHFLFPPFRFFAPLFPSPLFATENIILPLPPSFPSPVPPLLRLCPLVFPFLFCARRGICHKTEVEQKPL